MTTDSYEIYAVRYAHHGRRASGNFLAGDPHDGPVPLDYFAWAIVGATRLGVFATLKRLATSPRHVIPRDDPLVSERYPAAKSGLQGVRSGSTPTHSNSWPQRVTVGCGRFR